MFFIFCCNNYFFVSLNYWKVLFCREFNSYFLVYLGVKVFVKWNLFFNVFVFKNVIKKMVYLCRKNRLDLFIGFCKLIIFF